MKSRIVLKLIFFHLIAVVVLLVILSFYRCPIYAVSGIPCPGCGMSRAYKSLLRFDIVSAFEYHPLFLIAAPTVLYIAHKNKLKYRFNNKTEIFLGIVIIALFLVVYIYRL